MKILRIKVDGLPLYRKTFDISFCAVQRVQSNHMDSVFNLFGNIYVNTVEAFIGINASGKTTAIKVISFVNALLRAETLNAEYIPRILGDNQKAVFDIDFYLDNRVFHLNSELMKQKKTDGTYSVMILSEKLWMKTVSSKLNKTNLLDFSSMEPVRIRNNSDEYLPSDVSIMIAVNKQFKNNSIFVDLAMLTNFNLFFPEGGSVPVEIITLLDPSIEYIRVENENGKVRFRLKFFEQNELVMFHPGELYMYLSSGTVKGVRVFSDAARVLKNGGYLVVDEIENHFNRELVASLLRLFMNKKTNPKGAVIIFSTHYPELLDELDRNDSVFVTRSDKGLTVDNFNAFLKRNDMKKSEVYQSNFIGGTAPRYSALVALQKSIIKNQEE